MNILQRNNIVAIIIIGVVAFLVYANTIKNGFVYDDFYFHRREELRNSGSLLKVWTESYLPNNVEVGAYRPLTVASFAINYIFFGESPVSFHLFNILLHVLICLELYIILRLLKIPIVWCVLGSLIFAVHPVHVEAVAYIKARDELFHAFFLLLSINLVFLLKKKGIVLASFVFAPLFFLSLLAKEMAITIPLIVFIFLFYHKFKLKYYLSLIAMYIFMLLLYVWLRHQALGVNSFGSFYTREFVGNMLYTAPLTTRILTGFQIFWIYLTTLIFPYHLSATYGFSQIIPSTGLSTISSWGLGAFFFTTSLFATIVISLRKWISLAIALICFWIVYLPISQMLVPMGDIVAERWMYVPSIFLVIAVTIICSKFVQKSKVVLIVLSILIVIFSIRTIFRNQVWYSKLTLYESMVANAPLAVQARNALGQEYLTLRRIEEAKEQAEAGEQIYADYPQLQILLGNIALIEKRYPDAHKYFERASALEPNNASPYYRLGVLNFTQKKYSLAKDYFEFVFKSKRDPTYSDYLALAMTYTSLGQYLESITLIEKLPEKQQQIEDIKFLWAVNTYLIGDKSKALSASFWNPNLTLNARETKLLQLIGSISASESANLPL